MKTVSFGLTTIQKGRRIVLDSRLMQNLSVQEGEDVEVLLDVENELIVIKKRKKEGIRSRKTR